MHFIDIFKILAINSNAPKIVQFEASVRSMNSTIEALVLFQLLSAAVSREGRPYFEVLPFPDHLHRCPVDIIYKIFNISIEFDTFQLTITSLFLFLCCDNRYQIPVRRNGAAI